MGDLLLIDDNKDFREVFKITLANSGITRNIIEANGPIEGLEIFNRNRHKIQIVVCDFYMPIQNGTDVLDIIKAAEPSVCCCLLTGDDIVAKKKFTSVDKAFTKDNLAECITYLKNIDWRR
jgi:DNA-binding NtrC family response regulator